MNLKSADNRRLALNSLRILNNSQSSLLHQFIRESSLQLLAKPNAPQDQDAEESLNTKQIRFNSVLAVISTFEDTVDVSTRENLLSELIVIAHHPHACEFLQSVFTAI